MTWRGAAVCDACGRVLGGDVASWHPMMPAASRASEPSFLENISHLAGCIRCGLEHERLPLRRPRDAFVIRTAADGLLSGDSTPSERARPDCSAPNDPVLERIPPRRTGAPCPDRAPPPAAPGRAPRPPTAPRRAHDRTAPSADRKSVV